MELARFVNTYFYPQSLPYTKKRQKVIRILSKKLRTKEINAIFQATPTLTVSDDMLPVM